MSRFAAVEIALQVLFLALHVVLMVLAWRRSNGRAWRAFQLLITTETLRAANSLGWMWARAAVIDVNPWSVLYLVTTPFVIFAALVLSTELTKGREH